MFFMYMGIFRYKKCCFYSFCICFMFFVLFCFVLCQWSQYQTQCPFIFAKEINSNSESPRFVIQQVYTSTREENILVKISQFLNSKRQVTSIQKLELCFFKGVLHPWILFWSLCVLSQKINQLWTKHPMDLIRNVPRIQKSQFSFQ